MKEKRVDVYLAEAGYYHMVFIGFGGAFLNEIIQNDPRWMIVICSGLATIGLFVIIRTRFKKALSLTKKKRNKHSNYE